MIRINSIASALTVNPIGVPAFITAETIGALVSHPHRVIGHIGIWREPPCKGHLLAWISVAAGATKPVRSPRSALFHARGIA